MGKPNGKAALFALSLRRQMAGRSLSVRALGRLSDPADPERGRRRVQRHLSGRFLPSAASRVAYARALELPEEFFLDDDDDDFTRAPLAPNQVRQMRAAVRHEIREALGVEA